MLEVVRRDAAGIAILALSGQLVGGASGASLQAEVDALLSEGKRNVLLSMTNLSWISSSGLGDLVASVGTVRRAGGRLKVAEMTKRVELIIDISKLAAMLDFYPTEAAAIASFHASSEGA